MPHRRSAAWCDRPRCLMAVRNSHDVFGTGAAQTLGHEPQRSSCTEQERSDYDMVTWRQRVRTLLPQGAAMVSGDKGNGRGPVKNKNLRLSDGRILAPASSETDGKWLAFIDMSFDDGFTWEQQPNVPTRKPHRKYIPMIQPTLWESAPGKIHMLTRTNVGRIYRSDSADAGATWCMAYKTKLLNNNSGIDLVKTGKDEIFLVSNPVAENWGRRTPLTLMKSTDNGETWEEVLVLEKAEGEYSYPAIECKGNMLYITYTWNREKIAYWEIEV